MVAAAEFGMAPSAVMALTADDYALMVAYLKIKEELNAKTRSGSKIRPKIGN